MVRPPRRRDGVPWREFSFEESRVGEFVSCELNLTRTLAQWAGMKPEAVATGSKAQVVYALQDAQHDISALAERVAELERGNGGRRKKLNVGATTWE